MRAFPRVLSLIFLVVLVAPTPTAAADPPNVTIYDGGPFTNKTGNYALPQPPTVGPFTTIDPWTHVAAGALSRDQRLALVGFPAGGDGTPPPDHPHDPDLIDISLPDLSSLGTLTFVGSSSARTTLSPPAAHDATPYAASPPVGMSYAASGVAFLPFPVPITVPSLDYEICWTTTSSSGCQSALLNAPTTVDIDANSIADLVVTGAACGTQCFQLTSIRNPAGSSLPAQLYAYYDTDPSPTLSQTVLVGFDTQASGNHALDTFIGKTRFMSGTASWEANVTADVATYSPPYVYATALVVANTTTIIEHQDLNLTWSSSPPTSATMGVAISVGPQRSTTITTSASAIADLQLQYRRAVSGVSVLEKRDLKVPSLARNARLRSQASIDGPVDLTWASDSPSDFVDYAASGVTTQGLSGNAYASFGGGVKNLAIHRTSCTLAATSDAVTNLNFGSSPQQTISPPAGSYAVTARSSQIDEIGMSLPGLTSFLGSLECGNGGESFATWNLAANPASLYIQLLADSKVLELNAATDQGLNVARTGNLSATNTGGSQRLALTGTNTPTGLLTACHTTTTTCPQDSTPSDFVRLTRTTASHGGALRLHGVKSFDTGRASNQAHASGQFSSPGPSLRFFMDADADTAQVDLPSAPVAFAIDASASGAYHASSSGPTTKINAAFRFGATSHFVLVTGMPDGSAATLNLQTDAMSYSSTRPIQGVTVCVTTSTSCLPETSRTSIQLGADPRFVTLQEATSASSSWISGLVTFQATASNAHAIHILHVGTSVNDDVTICAGPTDVTLTYNGTGLERGLTYDGAGVGTDCLDGSTSAASVDSYRIHADYAPARASIREDFREEARVAFIDANDRVQSLQLRAHVDGEPWSAHNVCFTGVMNATLAWGLDLRSLNIDSFGLPTAEVNLGIAASGGNKCPDPTGDDHAHFQDVPIRQIQFQATGFRHAATELRESSTGIDLDREGSSDVRAHWTNGNEQGDLDIPNAPSYVRLSTDNARSVTWSAFDDGADFSVVALTSQHQLTTFVGGAPAQFSIDVDADRSVLTTTGQGPARSISYLSVDPNAVPVIVSLAATAISPTTITWSSDAHRGTLSSPSGVGDLEIAIDLHNQGAAAPLKLGIEIQNLPGKAFTYAKFRGTKTAEWRLDPGSTNVGITGDPTDSSQPFIVEDREVGSYTSVNISALPFGSVNANFDDGHFGNVASTKTVPWVNLTRITPTTAYLATFRSARGGQLELDPAAKVAKFSVTSPVAGIQGYWDTSTPGGVLGTNVPIILAGAAGIAGNFTVPIDPAAATLSIELNGGSLGRLVLWASRSGCYDSLATIDHFVLSETCGAKDLNVNIAGLTVLAYSSSGPVDQFTLRANQHQPFSFAHIASDGRLRVVRATAIAGNAGLTIDPGAAGNLRWDANATSGAITIVTTTGFTTGGSRWDADAGTMHANASWDASSGSLFVSHGPTTNARLCLQIGSGTTMTMACLQASGGPATVSWALSNPGSFQLDTGDAWVQVAFDARSGDPASPAVALIANGLMRANSLSVAWDYWTAPPSGQGGTLAMSAPSSICVLVPSLEGSPAACAEAIA